MYKCSTIVIERQDSTHLTTNYRRFTLAAHERNTIFGKIELCTVVLDTNCSKIILDKGL